MDSHKHITHDEIRQALGDRDALEVLLGQLAEQAAAGDRPSLDLLLFAVDEGRLAEPPIRRVLVNTEDVEEAAQDVLVAIAESIGSFRGEAQFTTWMWSIARYKALAVVRRSRPDPVDTSTDEPSVSDAVRISSMIADQESIQRLLDSLPDHYRDPVVLRDMEGMPYADVAEKLGLNLNTARSRIARGRALLASLVQ